MLCSQDAEVTEAYEDPHATNMVPCTTWTIHLPVYTPLATEPAEREWQLPGLEIPVHSTRAAWPMILAPSVYHVKQTQASLGVHCKLGGHPAFKQPMHGVCTQYGQPACVPGTRIIPFKLYRQQGQQ